MLLSICYRYIELIIVSWAFLPSKIVLFLKSSYSACNKLISLKSATFSSDPRPSAVKIVVGFSVCTANMKMSLRWRCNLRGKTATNAKKEQQTEEQKKCEKTKTWTRCLCDVASPDRPNVSRWIYSLVCTINQKSWKERGERRGDRARRKRESEGHARELFRQSNSKCDARGAY